MLRKGDSSIVILVLLVVGVVIFTLISFVNGGEKISEVVFDASVAENVRTKIQIQDFYLDSFVEQAVYDSYLEILENNNYMDSPRENPSGSGQWEFSDLKNLDFGLYFEENIKAHFNNNLESDSFVSLKNSFEKGDFETVYSSGVLTFTLKNVSTEVVYKDISIKNYRDVSVVFDFDKNGLHSFERIYEVKEMCKNEEFERVEECFSALNNFDVSVSKSVSENVFVNFESRKLFLVGELKKIEFGFVPK